MADHPFAELADYNALPRLSSLALSPDGRRLVAVVSELAPDGKTWRGALWDVDPAGERTASRLTRATKSESAPVFTPDGSVLFLSARPDNEAKSGEGDGDRSALWLLPASGEARQVYSPPGGVASVLVARRAGTLVLGTTVHPGAAVGGEDKAKRKAREDAGVTAILYEDYPVRHWDHDLGPDRLRLVSAPGIAAVGGRLDGVADLTGSLPHRIGDHASVSPDGRWVAYVSEVEVSPDYGSRDTVRVIGADGADDRELAADIDGTDGPRYSYTAPVFLPDSTAVLCLRVVESTAEQPPAHTLVRVELDSGTITDLTPDFPHWPEEFLPSPDGRWVFFVGNQRGRRPVWRLDLASGEIVQLTAEGAYSDLCVAEDASALYALRSSYTHPAEPVRIDPSSAGQTPVALPAPGKVPSLPGDLTEVETTVADGRTVRAWLAVPQQASAGRPAPLLLWVHGGPLMSWNSWSWRWNPWLAVARGYAVLLPDPALSTGYGPEF
ncbi:MAG: PD40 domain-containing protein, partial [Kutzneria sp.]|nr:PD40 domain-containing protein [Kutzneria sp.]